MEVVKQKNLSSGKGAKIKWKKWKPVSKRMKIAKEWKIAQMNESSEKEKKNNEKEKTLKWSERFKKPQSERMKTANEWKITEMNEKAQKTMKRKRQKNGVKIIWKPLSNKKENSQRMKNYRNEWKKHKNYEKEKAVKWSEKYI